MKPKKALKRLSRVEALLSDVLSLYAPLEQAVRESLSAAKAAVASARKSMGRKASAAAPGKQAVKSKKAQQLRVVPANQRKQSLAKRKTAAMKPKKLPKAPAGAKPREPKAKTLAKQKGPTRTRPVTSPEARSIDMTAADAASLAAPATTTESTDVQSRAVRI